MLMLRRALELLLVAERTGKKQRGQERSRILSGADRLRMMGIISDWFVQFVLLHFILFY
jgi:hypothetical protein